jgi:hypothetical protein
MIYEVEQSRLKIKSSMPTPVFIFILSCVYAHKTPKEHIRKR